MLNNLAYRTEKPNKTLVKFVLLNIFFIFATNKGAV